MVDVSVSKSDSEPDDDSYVIGTTDTGEYVSVDDELYTELEGIAAEMDCSLMDALTIRERRTQVYGIVNSVSEMVAGWDDAPPYQEVVAGERTLDRLLHACESGPLSPDGDEELETYLEGVEELSGRLRLLRTQYESAMEAANDDVDTSVSEGDDSETDSETPEFEDPENPIIEDMEADRVESVDGVDVVDEHDGD